MERVRRLYMAAIHNGDVGVGLLGFDDSIGIFRLRPGIGGFTVAQALAIALEDIDPADVFASFPGPGRRCDGQANGAVYSAVIGLQRPGSRIVTAEELQDLEHVTGIASRREANPCFAIDCVERLHNAVRETQRLDRPLGCPISFSSESMAARWSFVTKQNRELQEFANNALVALAECEGQSATFN